MGIGTPSSQSRMERPFGCSIVRDIGQASERRTTQSRRWFRDWVLATSPSTAGASRKSDGRLPRPSSSACEQRLECSSLTPPSADQIFE